MSYLKNWSVWLRGRQLAGAVEYRPPTLALRQASFQAGDMDVPLGVDDGLEALTVSLRLTGTQAQGLFIGLNTRLTVREGYTGYGGGFTGVEDVIEGKVIRSEPDARPALSRAETATTVTLSVAFYKRSVDGLERISLIPSQGIRRINGIDVLSVVSLMVLVSSTQKDADFDVLDFLSEGN